ncbi:MAG: hypothetical protein IJ829_05060 [Kiritimatiellae bacterium]|nr:hypothetical protein [Kiritimatiellia bacterium]
MGLILANLLCLASLGVSAADVFGGDDVEPSLFGFRLGQTIPLAGTNSVDSRALGIRTPSGWVCRPVVPEPQYQDSQFRDYWVFFDPTNRQVVSAQVKFAWPPTTLAPPPLFTNLLRQAFSRYGRCETRLSADTWSSGSIFRTSFFTMSGAEVVVSYHDHFGGELCICRAGHQDRLGLELPETYPKSALGRICNVEWRDCWQHPARELYEEYRSRRRSTIGIVEKHFDLSASKLKSKRIPHPAWKSVSLSQGTGRFSCVLVNRGISRWMWGPGTEVWEFEARVNHHTVVFGELRLFDSTADAYACGMELVTARLLPGAMLCELFHLAGEIPDVCLVAPVYESCVGEARPTAILIRANAVLACTVIDGPSETLAADAGLLLDLFAKKAGMQ